jgi:hypothetical protein
MAKKRIELDEQLNDRLKDVVLKLKIKKAKPINQEELILSYIDNGLVIDEKKLIDIKL